MTAMPRRTCGRGTVSRAWSRIPRETTVADRNRVSYPAMPEAAVQGTRCLATIAIFAVLVAPLYLVFRLLVGLVRDAYGFSSGDSERMELCRVCGGCHNTVMEPDFEACPYCGRPLPPVAAPADSVATGREGAA